MKLLKGRTAIITGGSRGIGKACCIAFAREGADVVFTYKNSRKQAAAVVAEISDYGVSGLAVQADVRNIEQCRHVVEKTLRKFRKYDILINNAGIACDKPLFMMTDVEWHTVIDTDLNGVYNMTRVAITNLLKQKEGAIINISSVSGVMGLPGQTNYSAAKAGIIGFSKALAKESAAYGVTVNVVAPGFISTDMVSLVVADKKDKYKEAIPTKRFGTPEEVADLCAYLASTKAKYITGDVIKIDGGLAI